MYTYITYDPMYTYIHIQCDVLFGSISIPFPKLVEETAGEVLDVEGPLQQNPGETFTEKTYLRQEKAAGAGAISGGGHVRPPSVATRAKRHICGCN